MNVFLRILFCFSLLFVFAACSSSPEVATVETAVPPTDVPPTEVSPTEIPSTEENSVELVDEVVEDAVVTQVYQLVPEQSEVRYRVEEEFFQGAVESLGQTLGFFEAIGTTRTVEGSLFLTIDEGRILVDGGEFSVDLRTLDSGETRRDRRIRERHLESNQYPFAVYVITGVESFPEEYTEGDEIVFKLVGDMTIRELTNEVVFETTAVLRDGKLTGSATSEIFMVDFGFEPPAINGFLEALDPARIEIDFTAEG